MSILCSWSKIKVFKSLLVFAHHYAAVRILFSRCAEQRLALGRDFERLRRLAFDSDVDSLNISEDRAMQVVAHTNGCDACRTRLAAHDATRQRFARYLARSRT